MQHQRVSVSSPADDDLPGVQQLAVPVPLHLGRRGGVDGAGDLHLVPVPAVDECFLLLYLRLVLHVQADLEQKVRIFVAKLQMSHLSRGRTAPAVVREAVVNTRVVSVGVGEL